MLPVGFDLRVFQRWHQCAVRCTSLGTSLQGDSAGSVCWVLASHIGARRKGARGPAPPRYFHFLISWSDTFVASSVRLSRERMVFNHFSLPWRMEGFRVLDQPFEHVV